MKNENETEATGGHEKPKAVRIAMGECVSPRGVDHCTICIDVCEASGFKRELSETLGDLKIDRP